MNTRPPQPEIVTQWEEWLRAGPPRCCHTCEHYSKTGDCMKFDMRPPEQFAATPDACDEYFQEVPF
jgi:hypothetical protein